MTTGLCLPSKTRELVAQLALGERHPGLQLDKLSPPGEQAQQKEALADVVRTGGDGDLLRKLLARRQTHLGSLSARVWRAETASPLTLHLARASALENAGLCLHPLYGFAYLPGSGLKGMARAYAETAWLPAEADPVAAWQRIERVFGWTSESDKGKAYKPEGVPKHADDDRSRVGAVVFHDAWPETWPSLMVDITNNHHAQYYQGGDKDAPGDWENPVPVSFLALPPGLTFSIALALQVPEAEVDELLDLATRWLQGALCHSGAGAKTNAGYGAFRLLDADQPQHPQSPALATWDTTLELVTPAFLAGAGQQADDCDLRPASLRGLLRWWWRTMHAGFVDVATLRALEASVWGNSEAGGAVRLSVDRAEAVSPVHFAFKDGFDPIPQFKKEHDLEDRPNKKTTQGLFYASYGMDETSKGQRRARWFMPSSARWRLCLTARPTRYPSDPKAKGSIKVPADVVLCQAKAALWLLCRYGGVGSKSRKGFGSFVDIDGFTLESCKQVASDFRRLCSLAGAERDADTPSLEGLLDLELATPWKDPWFVLDQVGYAAQGFAQRYKHNAEKTALGLPRKIHGPRNDGPIERKDGTLVQDPHTWQRPVWLGEDHPKRDSKTTPDRFRDAAPVHYHLAKTADGSLTIRVTAFPSPYLPDREASRRVLTELLDHLRDDLARRIEKHRDKGRKEPSRETAAAARATPPPQLPKPGDRVEAELIEEKRGRNKDKWQARHGPTGWVGYVHNSADVPADAEAGQRVTLIVDLAKQSDFRLLWPTPEQEAKMQQRLAPPAPRKGGPRRR